MSQEGTQAWGRGAASSTRRSKGQAGGVEQEQAGNRSWRGCPASAWTLSLRFPQIQPRSGGWDLGLDSDCGGRAEFSPEWERGHPQGARDAALLVSGVPSS